MVLRLDSMFPRVGMGAPAWKEPDEAVRDTAAARAMLLLLVVRGMLAAAAIEAAQGLIPEGEQMQLHKFLQHKR